LNGSRPFFSNVHRCQVEQFTDGLLGGKRAFVLDNLAQLAMVAFNRVGCINQAADFLRELKEGCQVVPAQNPASNRDCLCGDNRTEIFKLRFVK
jgi:hypothetical protein